MKAKMRAMASMPIDEKDRLRSKYGQNIASDAKSHYELKYGKNPHEFT